ncbi:MAG: hypothetical protein RL691_444 [Actinomycetota bacterium]
MDQVDTERRSRLLALKLRALIREHLGLSGDPDGRVEVFAPGAAFITNDAVWLLIDGNAARALGGVLAWGTKFELPIHLVVENDSGLLARRAALFDVDVTVWHADERVLLPALAEPHLPTTQAKPEHLAFTELIQSSGADALVEHGIVVGEVRGLEMCRVVDDVVSGVARLEVGMGVNDREAFAMVHGELPTEQALRNVIDAVATHREPGANVHPFNQFGSERMHRWRALQDPTSIGFSRLDPVDPPVKRTNLKDAVPCAAIGSTDSGNLSAAVFVHGVDLDVVPFAVDTASRLGIDEVTVVARRQDITPSIERLANMASVFVRFAFISSPTA